MSKIGHGGKRAGAGRKSTGRTQRKTLFLSPHCVELIAQFDRPAEIVEQALRICLPHSIQRAKKGNKGGLSLGQIHLREIVLNRIEEFKRLIQKRKQEGFDSVRKEFSNFWLSLRDDLFANYFVHTDPITAQPLDNSSISELYLQWLELIGQLKEKQSTELKIRLDRYFHEDESDWFRMPFNDLAFSGGSQFESTYYWLFQLALGEKNQGIFAHWPIYYYEQEGIVRSTIGSPRLLAHVLWGENVIQPDRTLIIDAQPAPELNRALLGWQAFFDELNNLPDKDQTFKEDKYFALDYKPPKTQAQKDYYLAQGQLITELWQYLEQESTLTEYLQSLLTYEYGVAWDCGSTSQQSFTIYQLWSLIEEICNIAQRPFFDPRNPLILEFRNKFSDRRESNSLEDWFSHLTSE